MAFVLAMGLGSAGCKQTCQDDVSREEGCGWMYRDGACSDPAFACERRCFRALECGELARVYFEDGSLPPSVDHCLWSCIEGVACDGEPARADVRACDGFVECADGADERACDYHACDDGQKVVSDARCDGYTHCMDGSDEDGC